MREKLAIPDSFECVPFWSAASSHHHKLEDARKFSNDYQHND